MPLVDRLLEGAPRTHPLTSSPHAAHCGAGSTRTALCSGLPVRLAVRCMNQLGVSAGSVPDMGEAHLAPEHGSRQSSTRYYRREDEEVDILPR